MNNSDLLKLEHRWRRLREAIIGTQDSTTLVNALRLAASVYEQDAIDNAAKPRLAEQFTRQAETCRAIADIVEP